MKLRNHSAVVALTVATLLNLPTTAQILRGARQVSPNASQTQDLRPTGKGWGEADSNAPPKVPGATTNGISYHGGPVILGTTSVYYIWYGNWSADTSGQSILLNFASHIGGSPYYNIETTYYNGAGTHISNSVAYKSSTTDNYSQGTSFGDTGVRNIVANAINSGKLPKTASAVYFVLTTKDVKETSGFCTKYCGWHTHTTIAGTDIKYAFVGNPSQQCPSGCEEQTTKSPNGNPGADGMANVIAHELDEAVTDPDLNAWYDSRGNENADKCAWTFGATKTASNGSLYNMTLGSRQYLIQRNWVNASGGFCALSH